MGVEDLTYTKPDFDDLSNVFDSLSGMLQGFICGDCERYPDSRLDCTVDLGCPAWALCSEIEHIIVIELIKDTLKYVADILEIPISEVMDKYRRSLKLDDMLSQLGCTKVEE